tara:strand:+ start:132 stop:1424 length:1293 start_codon:yes stop_codon:yes gene_type:complete
MKLINKITIDQSPMPSALTVRQFTVFGDPGAVFSLTITNEDNHFYNFSEELDKNNALKTAIGFSATPARLLPKTINNNGEYTGVIQFPAITDDDVYSITLYAESVSDTFLDSNFEDKTTYILPNIHKYLDTTVTFSLVSAGSNSVYNDYPSDVTAKGFSSLLLQNNNISDTISISWNVTLGSSQFIIARQPVITDFQFTTTSTSKTAGSSTKIVEVTDITGLSKNMGVSGTGIASGSVITDIVAGYIDTNNSSDIEDIYIVPKKVITDLNGVQTVGDDPGGTVTIDKASSYSAGITLTFTGKGSDSSKVFNNTVFSVQNFLLTIEPVVTTTDAAVSNSATIPITSTNGIKAVDTVLITGIGVTNASPHVDAISSGVNVTASSAQTIENGQTLTFTGSSRSATITADVNVLKFGKDDITLTLALDNILTVG